MASKIFVNLPIKNLSATMEFFRQLGYGFNMHFTNEDAACMVISDDIFVMLLTEPFFQRFTKKEIADAKKTTEVLLALSVDSRQEVDDMVAKAIAAGGKTPVDKQDHGFMYSWGFEDLDGHQWEVFWMDPEAAKPATENAAAATEA